MPSINHPVSVFKCKVTMKVTVLLTTLALIAHTQAALLNIPRYGTLGLDALPANKPGLLGGGSYPVYPSSYPISYPSRYPTRYPGRYPITYPSAYPATYPITYPSTYPYPSAYLSPRPVSPYYTNRIVPSPYIGDLGGLDIDVPTPVLAGISSPGYDNIYGGAYEDALAYRTNDYEKRSSGEASAAESSPLLRSQSEMNEK